MTTISDLPDEVMNNILVRLPVKSIIRCRCVCRSWCTLLSSPGFSDLHLNQANQGNPNLIISLNRYAEFYSIDCEVCDEAVSLNLDLNLALGVSIVGSLNGLICLSNYDNFLALWNPATKKYSELPCAPLQQHALFMGFGYDPDWKEYKVIKGTLDSTCSGYPVITGLNALNVMVFTVGTFSWRRIEPPSGIYCTVNNAKPLYLKGVLHWGALHGFSRVITAFSVKDEKFEHFPWPTIDFSSYHEQNLGVLKGCLSVFGLRYSDSVDIWQMKDYGRNESWTMLFSVGRPTIIGHFIKLKPLFFQKTGELLLQMDKYNLLLYDPVNSRATVPVIHGLPWKFRPFAFVETLKFVETHTSQGEILFSSFSMVGNRLKRKQHLQSDGSEIETKGKGKVLAQGREIENTEKEESGKDSKKTGDSSCPSSSAVSVMLECSLPQYSQDGKMFSRQYSRWKNV